MIRLLARCSRGAIVGAAPPRRPPSAQTGRPSGALDVAATRSRPTLPAHVSRRSRGAARASSAAASAVRVTTEPGDGDGVADRAADDGDATSAGGTCAQGLPLAEDDEEEEQEEMFVVADPVLGLGAVREWGGPTRGGRLSEPTRYGDWERKGRCTDF